MGAAELINKLNIVLADTYALYLKSQNYHWHVKGPNFKTIHDFLEEHYTDLAEAVDDVAERIVMLNGTAMANFVSLAGNKTISDATPTLDAKSMLSELSEDHDKMMVTIHNCLSIAQKSNDEVTIGLLVDRLAWHEKAKWMLTASI